jgi:hypothetical protein
MTIKSSGSSLTFTEIYTEFGLPPGRNLGAYRVSQTVSGLSNLALDNEVNNSGIITALMPQPESPIKFSDFYNKKLNVVVNCTPSINNVATKVNARSNYTNNSSTIVIGGFKTKPTSSAQKKVWIHTNGDLGSDGKAPLRDLIEPINVSFTVSRGIFVSTAGAVINFVAAGYPTITFGPIAAGSSTVTQTIYKNVRYTITTGSGQKVRVTNSNTLDAEVTSASTAFNDLRVSLVDTTQGSFSGGPISTSAPIYYLFTGRQDVVAEYSSLLTGTWDSGTDLRLDIGPSGRVAGAGGAGGRGGLVLYNGDLSSGTGSPGKNGTSGLGIQYTPIIITNRGSIISGGGGGGGGGAASGYYKRNGITNNDYFHSIAGGSGGGGGIGYPGGSVGAGGTVVDSYADNDGSSAIAGNPGLPGSITSGGNGGKGSGRVTSSSTSAAGGGGGGGMTGGLGGANATDTTTTAGFNAISTQAGIGGTGAGSGPDYGRESAGGPGGTPGYAIVVTNVGTGVTIINNGTIIGVTTYSTTPQ